MEIKIALKGNRALCIQFGFKTPWYGSIDWFTVVIEDYDEHYNVYYATHKFGMFRKRYK